ncbi:MAG TPA: hypothetical protein VFG12_05510, partial [Rhodopila sp.]|nr:hypothetical protein [Rhodopila sp.]
MAPSAIFPPKLHLGRVTIEWHIPLQPGPNNVPPGEKELIMTRISGLLVATGLAILPISAFAQQAAAP